MDALAEKLDTKLRTWKPETAAQVRERVAEVIELADEDVLDVMRSRPVSRKCWTCSMSPQPGEVWLADLGLAAKTRPVVIVSRFDPDAPRALVIYVPLTTQNRMSRYEVPLPKLPFLDRDSVANVQGVASIPTVHLERRLGRLSGAVMTELKRSLAFALDFD